MERTPLYDLTVGQYQLLREIDPDLSPIEQNIYAVAAIKDITYDEARLITITEFNEILRNLDSVDVTALEKKKINNNIKLGGKPYWIEHDPSKLTSGQLLDIINIRSKNKGEHIKVMDLIIATLCKPKGEKYGSDNLNLQERAALCRDVKISEVWNIFFFFYNLWNRYLIDTEDYLSKWMEETLQTTKQILDKGGDSSQ